MNLVVTPSKLERFRLHVTGAYHDTITKEKVIESIRGDVPWNPKMEFGTAFHAIIEHGPESFYNPLTGQYDVKIEGVDEVCTLDPREIIEAVNHRKKYPLMVHEVPAKYYTRVGVLPVRVNMRLDGMNGAECHEHKTTDRPADRTNYEDSIQWRLNLLATGGKSVQYNVFQYDNPRSGPRTITPHSFTFVPYSGMKSEVDKWISRLIEFCEVNDLIPFIDWDQIDWDKDKDRSNPLL